MFRRGESSSFHSQEVSFRPIEFQGPLTYVQPPHVYPYGPMPIGIPPQGSVPTGMQVVHGNVPLRQQVPPLKEREAVRMRPSPERMSKDSELFTPPALLEALGLKPSPQKRVPSLERPHSSNSNAQVGNTVQVPRSDEGSSGNAQQTQPMPSSFGQNALNSAGAHSRNGSHQGGDANVAKDTYVDLLREESKEISAVSDYQQNEHNPASSSQPEFVTENFQQGSRYEGYKVRGMRNGHGKFYYQDGGLYDGNWKNNKMDGFGALYYDSQLIAYEGMWKNDQFHGHGKLYNENPEPLEDSFDFTNFDKTDNFWVSYEGNLSIIQVIL